ncbi:unnamed protein product [Clonostachys chloroleuca]|uniref:Uncharacterized protein n=1 Tax=Clonostachys chloroleuca TaxID=1926264 RepID=A0AA35VMX4_9HYPO|nr:unnamed protein product [Clonostachys chloroleuca]
MTKLKLFAEPETRTSFYSRWLRIVYMTEEGPSVKKNAAAFKQRFSWLESHPSNIELLSRDHLLRISALRKLVYSGLL